MKALNVLLDNTPNDIYSNFYFQLPIYDRGVVFPLVCKRWHQFASEAGDRKKCLKILIGNIYANHVQIYSEKKYDNDQRRKLLKICFRNNLISELKNLSFSFFGAEPRVHPQNLYDENLMLCSSVAATDYYYKSNFFDIVWDPKKIEIGINKKVKTGNMRTAYMIGVYRCAYILDKTSPAFGLIFNIYTPFEGVTEKRKAFSWKKTTLKYASHLYDMMFIIGHALRFTLQNHIERLAESNLQRFAEISKIEDIKSKIICMCNDDGLIEQISHDREKPSEGSINSFAISVQGYKDIKGFKILNWEIFDPNKILDRPDCWKFSQVLQWCVLSRTMEHFSKKLGVFLNPIDAHRVRLGRF